MTEDERTLNDVVIGGAAIESTRRANAAVCKAAAVVAAELTAATLHDSQHEQEPFDLLMVTDFIAQAIEQDDPTFSQDDPTCSAWNYCQANTERATLLYSAVDIVHSAILKFLESQLVDAINRGHEADIEVLTAAWPNVTAAFAAHDLWPLLDTATAADYHLGQVLEDVLKG